MVVFFFMEEKEEREYYKHSYKMKKKDFLKNRNPTALIFLKITVLTAKQGGGSTILWGCFLINKDWGNGQDEARR